MYTKMAEKRSKNDRMACECRTRGASHSMINLSLNSEDKEKRAATSKLLFLTLHQRKGTTAILTKSRNVSNLYEGAASQQATKRCAAGTSWVALMREALLKLVAEAEMRSRLKQQSGRELTCR